MPLMLIKSPETPQEPVVSETPDLAPVSETGAPVTHLEAYKELGRVSLSPVEYRELEAAMHRHPAGSAFKHKK